MKCLICSYQNNEADELFQHYVNFHDESFQQYVNFHQIYRSSYYLKALFQIDSNSLLLKKCPICDEIFYKDRDSENRNFIKHYK